MHKHKNSKDSEATLVSKAVLDKEGEKDGSCISGVRMGNLQAAEEEGAHRAGKPRPGNNGTKEVSR